MPAWLLWLQCAAPQALDVDSYVEGLVRASRVSYKCAPSGRKEPPSTSAVPDQKSYFLCSFFASGAQTFFLDWRGGVM